MPNIKNISSKDFERFLVACGCTFKRERGYHRTWVKPGLLRSIVVPRRKVLAAFIIANGLHTLGKTKEDLLVFLS